MNTTKKYWYEKVVKMILETNTDVLFIVDKLGFSNFSEVKSATSESYPHIVRYESEIKLRIWLRQKEKPLIVLFSYEKDIPYHMLSKYALIMLDTDIMFPLLDKKTISIIPLSNYQLVYDFYMDNIYENIYERLSEEDTENLIEKSVSAND